MRWIIIFFLAINYLWAIEPELLSSLELGGMALHQVEVVRTPEAQQKGLMDRTFLPPDAGMCFVFDPPHPTTFWMKNTRVALDVIYCDAAGRILDICTMHAELPRAATESEEAYEARLPLYPCRGMVFAALEVNAGLCKQLGLHRGMMLPGLAAAALAKI